MRKTQIILSLMLFGVVLYEDITHLPGLSYLAVFSLLPLIYGMKNRDYLIYFPLILAFAYVPLCFLYNLTLYEILKMSVIWPMFFAVFSMLSYPESGDLEKRAVVTWLVAGGMAALGMGGALYLSYPVENVVILAVLGIVAGISMLYITYGE